LGKLQFAIFKHMEEIVFVERRAFSCVDFRPFEYEGRITVLPAELCVICLVNSKKRYHTNELLSEL